MKPRVLLIEDSQQWARSIKRGLSEFCEVVYAESQDQARQLFAQHKGDFQVIVMDSCVPGDQPNTHTLTRDLRAQFEGPIVANSSLEHYFSEIVKAGASEGVFKYKLVERIRELVK